MTCSLCFSKACVPARRLPCSPVRVESRAQNRQTKGFKGMGLGVGGEYAIISEASLLNKDSQPLLFLFASKATPLPLPSYAVLPCLRHLQDREMTTLCGALYK